MRAGLLKEPLVFKELRSVRTPTGALRKEYVEVYRCRGYKRRLFNSSSKDNVDALEEFYGNFVIMQVRCSPSIHSQQIVEYNGANYKIVLLDPQPDSTYIANLTKINE